MPMPNGSVNNKILEKFKMTAVPGLQPLKLEGDKNADAHLLTSEEKELCKTLRIQAKPFIMLKEAVMKESIEHGGVLKKKNLKELTKLDTTKANKLFDFFVNAGVICKA